MCPARPDAVGRAPASSWWALLRQHNMRLRSNIRELNLSSVQAISL